jgi:hypothetical protein
MLTALCATIHKHDDTKRITCLFYFSANQEVPLWPDYEEVKCPKTRESDENIHAQLGLGRRFTATWNSLRPYILYNNTILTFFISREEIID